MTSAHLKILAPPSLGPSLAPYSQGVVANGVVYLAGQVSLNAQGQVVAPGEIGPQTATTIQRMRTLMEEAGGTLDDIVSATVYLTDLSDFPGFNDAWSKEFGDHRPARATVRADLALPGLVVEIMAIAVLGA